MRVTAKGQVTIPLEIRERAGFVPGTEVDFVLDGDSVLITRAQKPGKETHGERAVRLLRGTGKWPAQTTDEIMRLLRGDDEEA